LSNLVEDKKEEEEEEEEELKCFSDVSKRHFPWVRTGITL
jgi:hypothetical protein